MAVRQVPAPQPFPVMSAAARPAMRMSAAAEHRVFFKVLFPKRTVRTAMASPAASPLRTSAMLCSPLRTRRMAVSQIPAAHRKRMAFFLEVSEKAQRTAAVSRVWRQGRAYPLSAR